MMAAPEITASTRYSAKGTARYVFCTTLSDIESPTRAEIDAGTDLSRQVQDIDGWTVESESIETPDLASTFTGSIPGSTSADDSSLTMYADLGGTDVRTLLPRGTNGFMLVMRAGDADGRMMDVFPVRVGSTAVNITVDDDPVTITVNFSVTSEPAENVTIPT